MKDGTGLNNLTAITTHVSYASNIDHILFIVICVFPCWWPVTLFQKHLLNMANWSLASLSPNPSGNVQMPSLKASGIFINLTFIYLRYISFVLSLTLYFFFLAFLNCLPGIVVPCCCHCLQFSAVGTAGLKVMIDITGVAYWFKWLFFIKFNIQGPRTPCSTTFQTFWSLQPPKIWIMLQIPCYVPLAWFYFLILFEAS